MSSIPNLVEEDIREAVDSAIQFGVTVEEFMKTAARHWDAALYEKRERDANAWAKRIASN